MGKRPGIYKRADGRWSATVTVGYEVTPDGKRKRKRQAIYGKTQSEVFDLREEILQSLRAGSYVAPVRQTVAEYLAYWLEHRVQPRLKRTTWSNYDNQVRLHMVPVLGSIRLQQLSIQDIQAFLHGYAGSHYSYLTMITVFNTLKGALKQAVKWRMIPRNPAQDVEVPSPPRRIKSVTDTAHTPMHVLTPAQASVFLKSIRGDRLEAFYKVALTLGLRKGEALGLWWEDVDLDGRKLTIRRNLQYVRGEVYLDTPKSENASRVVPLPLTLVAALKEHRVRQYQERLKLGARWTETPYVFTTRKGTHLNPITVWHYFQGASSAQACPPSGSTTCATARPHSCGLRASL